MSEERIIIAGGGVSGLVAAWAFQEYGKSVVVLEPGVPGGDFTKGGLKYIHKTKAITDMFDSLGLVWSDYTVRGGILLRGSVHKYPQCMDGMSEQESSRIQADHYVKTRRAEPDDFGARSMNDPAARKNARRAIRCDFGDMIARLSSGPRILKAGLAEIDSRGSRVKLTDGSWHGYDRLIVTLPLWVVRRMADFYVPHGLAVSLNIVHVSPRRDRYAAWDYVYTPYTPADCVHRISPSGSGYSVEANGDWDKIQLPLVNDLGFLFPDGFTVDSSAPNLKGHLLPLTEVAAWPENVVPLGRFAQWDPRATTDVTLAAALARAEEWWG